MTRSAKPSSVPVPGQGDLPDTAPSQPRARSERSRARGNDPEGTRTDIMAVATAHFARHGLSGSRVDEIAEETHTSKRMLYYYFESKEGLYRAVLARCYAGIRAHEQSLALEGLAPREALATLVARTFDYHDANPDFVRIVMVENIHLGRHIGSVTGLGQRRSGALDQLTELLGRGVEAGVFRAGIDPLDLHLTINGLSFYNVSNRHTVRAVFGRDMGGDAEREARRAVIVETILRWVCQAP